MEQTLARLRVLLGAAPTYLAAIGAVLAIVIDELAGFADQPGVEWVVRIAGVVLTIVGVATAIVRRVTPVIDSQRGLLPPPDGAPVIPASNPREF